MNRLLTIVDSKYQRLEYLESTGTQYIDTGYVPNPNTEIDTKLKIVSWGNTSYGAIFGCRTNNHASDTFLLCRYYTNDYCRFEIDGAYHTNILNLSEGIDCIVSIASTKFVCNDTDYNINMNRISPNDKHLFLFGLNEGGHIETVYGSASTRIYHFKISENGVVKKNFVPVLRKTDNELGMLDLVEGKFYPNAGTGKFTANLDTMYAIIQGSPTQSPYGVFSGFSTSNYLEIQGLYDFSKPFEIKTKIHLNSNPNASSFIRIDGSSTGYAVIMISQLFAIGVYIGANDGTTIFSANATPNNTIPVNKDVFIRFVFTGTEYAIYVSVDNTETKYLIATTSKVIGSNEYILLGANPPNQSFAVGTIDLNKTNIKLGSTKYNLQAVVGYTIVGSPTIVDGVLSNTSSSNFIRTPNFPEYSSLEAEVVTTISSATSSFQSIFALTGNYAIVFEYRNAVAIRYRIYNDSATEVYSGTYNIVVNQPITINLKIKGNNAVITIIQNGTIKFQSSYSITRITGNSRFQLGYFWQGLTTGSIDLNKTFVKLDNKLWFNGQEG